MILRKLAVPISLLVVLFGLTSCGGNGSSSAQNLGNVTPGIASSTLFSIGDAPSDKIVSFEVTINSVALTDANGASVTILNRAFRIELTHLAASFVPVANLSVPQGTYNKVTVTFSNPEVVLLNPDGTTVKREPPITNGTTSAALNPNLVVGVAATALSLDVNVAQSVTFDAAGNATVSPAITVGSGAAAPAQNKAENGKIEDTRGTVATVAADSFTINVNDGAQTLTFKVDANTQFHDIAGLSALKQGMQVEVNGNLQLDGSMLATSVEAEGEDGENEQEMRNAMELEGLIVNASGTPTNSISIVARDVSSSSNNSPSLGSTIDVALDSNTRFDVKSKNLTLTSLPFTPTFDQNSITKGQNVEVDADSLATSPVPARKISLREQSITGVASAIQSGTVRSFTLTVPSDSAFAMLTGSTTVAVYQVTATELKDIPAVTEGATIRVRGLLFLDGSTLRLVAIRISKP